MKFVSKRTVMEYQLLNLIIDGERFLGSITEINESQLDKIKRFNHIILFGARKDWAGSIKNTGF